MGKYTILADQGADRAVQNVIDQVIDGIVGLLGNRVRAIVLAGGYGRGEGGAYSQNGDFCLVNDLDIIIFVRGSVHEAKIRFEDDLTRLSNQLLIHGRGLQDIHIDLKQLWHLRFLVQNTVSYYEMSEGHQVIYGDLQLKKIVRHLNPARLPLYEGTNYFRNRGSGLLIPMIYVLSNSLDNPKKKENFQIEIQKACQAMGDASLLMIGQYHFSYHERLQRFRRLRSGNSVIPGSLLEKITPLYEWGVANKLTPSFEWSGNQQMIQKWFQVCEMVSEFFLWYESVRLKCNFRAWNEYVDHVINHGAGEPLDLKMRSKVQSSLQAIQTLTRKEDRTIFPLQRNRNCLAIMPLLVFSLKPGMQVDSSFVAMAARLMQEKCPAVNIALWEKLVVKFLLTYYPYGAVLDAVA